MIITTISRTAVGIRQTSGRIAFYIAVSFMNLLPT
jgi:hypothetical protein